jgi:hypothetical protein
MTENERFKNVIDFLIANRIIRNQQQFVEEIHSDKATVSQIKNGKLNIPNEMFEKITNSFPCISLDWLKEEKGEMLKINGVGHSTFGNFSPIKGNIEINSCLAELEKEKQKNTYLERIIKDKEQIIELLLKK